VPWECCATMNNNWGYCAADQQYKSADVIVRKLVECVSKDGNLILNVSPDARGNIPTRQQSILREVGEWMALNGESIYGCGSADMPKPDWGRLTRRGDTIYAHILEQPLGAVCIPGLRGRAKSIRRVADGAQAYAVTSWVTDPYPNDLFLSLDQVGVQTVILPPTPDYVLKFTLTEGADKP
ncbi:MAG: alpha-L-fucosidase, partial [Aristaeellaceae bacterium]